MSNLIDLPDEILLKIARETSYFEYILFATSTRFFSLTRYQSKYDNYFLVQLAQDGELEVFQYIFRMLEQNDPIVNDNKTFKRTIKRIDSLFNASCISGHLELAKLFVSKGADIFHDKTLLPWSANCGRFNIVKYFVENGVDPSIHYNNAIRWACCHGRLEIVRYLIELGCDTGGLCDGPFAQAARNGHIPMVEFLINGIGGINKKIKIDQKKLNNALKEACGNGKLDMAKYLVENSANIISCSDDVILSASINGQLEVIEYLVSCGVKVTIRKNTAIKQATKYGHKNMVEYLVKHGADIYANDCRPIINAFAHNHLEIAKYFIDLTISLDLSAQIDHFKDLLLDYSTTNGWLELTIYFIENGADIHYWQERALHSACKNGYTEIVTYLIKKGAIVTARENKALRTATNNRHHEIVKLLKENGAYFGYPKN